MRVLQACDQAGFVLEAEDGTVQGQSVGLKGRVKLGGAPGGQQ